MADITTSKLIWNSFILFTPGSQYSVTDVKFFYLGTPVDSAEYTRIRIDLRSQGLIKGYNLNTKAKDGHIHMKPKTIRLMRK